MILVYAANYIDNQLSDLMRLGDTTSNKAIIYFDFTNDYIDDMDFKDNRYFIGFQL